MSVNPDAIKAPDRRGDLAEPANQVVLLVDDHQSARSELKQVLELNGYRVIDTDNGQDAARCALAVQPDLLLVDLDVPLLYGLVAARQIVGHAQLGPLPVVIVTHDDELDPEPIMEVGALRHEYVTRLRDYEQLEDLLDYLLPVLTAPAEAALNDSSNLQLSAMAHS